MRFGPEKIDAIAFAMNTGAFIYAGKFPETYTDLTRTFAPDEPMLGFFGTFSEDNKEMYSIGEIVVIRECIPKKKEAQEEEVVEPTSKDNSETSFSDQQGA